MNLMCLSIDNNQESGPTSITIKVSEHPILPSSLTGKGGMQIALRSPFPWTDRGLANTEHHPPFLNPLLSYPVQKTTISNLD